MASDGRLRCPGVRMSEDRDPAVTARVDRPRAAPDPALVGDRGRHDRGSRRGVGRPVIDPGVPGPTELPVRRGRGRPIAVARRVPVDLLVAAHPVDAAHPAHPEARVAEERPAGRVPMIAAGATGRQPARTDRRAAMTRRRAARCRAARARGPRAGAQARAPTVHRTEPDPTDRTADPTRVPKG